MTLKQRIISLSCAAGVLIIISFCAFVYPALPVGAAGIPDPMPPAGPVIAAGLDYGETKPAAKSYVLKDADGFIGVYDSADTSGPIYVTDIEVKLLRKTDQNLLKKGIFAKDTQALAMLLEDFGS